MMTGFLLRYDSLEEHSCLTDEQYGRIIRAALRYARDGTEPELPEPERFLWPGLRQKVMYDRAQYEKKCAQNSENIKKRWEQQRKDQQEQDDTTVYDRIRTNTNDTNINIKSNINNNNNIKSNQIQSQDMEQLRAEGYTGEEIERALKRCEGKRVRNLPAYIRQSIENERTQAKRILPAQDFTQRDYSGVQDEMMKNLAEEMRQFKEQQEGNT